jgi:hypothetical protein
MSKKGGGKSGAVEVLSGLKYFPCNGRDAVGRISVPLKLSLTTDKRGQFHIQASNRESFQKVPSRAFYLKRMHMIARARTPSEV